MLVRDGTFRRTSPPVSQLFRWPLLLALLACGSACSSAQDGSGDIGHGEGTIEWFEPMSIAGAPTSDLSEWDAWFTRPWEAFGESPSSFEVSRMECPNGECEVVDEMVVRSCDQLLAANRRNLEVPDLEQRSHYSQWRAKCYAARLLMQTASGAATRSYVGDFTMDERHLRALPAEVALIEGPAQEQKVREIKSAGGTLGEFIEDVVPSARSIEASVGPQQVVLRDANEWIRSWALLARGDFDADGYSDLLIAARLSTTDGYTVDLHRLMLVTRRSADGPYEMAGEISLEPGGSWCQDFVDKCVADPTDLRQ